MNWTFLKLIRLSLLLSLGEDSLVSLPWQTSVPHSQRRLKKKESSVRLSTQNTNVSLISAWKPEGSNFRLMCDL